MAKKITGMRRRVATGFLSIVCLLVFSGTVSFVELNRLSRDTEDVLQADERNVAMAREMLDAAHDQNVALIHISIFHDRSYDSLCRASLKRLEENLALARKRASESDRRALDSIAYIVTPLRVLTDTYLSGVDISKGRADSTVVAAAQRNRRRSGSTGVMGPEATPGHWYTDTYEGLYSSLTLAIRNYMTATQSSLTPSTELLRTRAYRAVTPVLISLAVMIATVLMLFYFMMVYCVIPIVRLNKALGDFLTFRVPFTVKGESRDETLELKDKIETLIGMSKQPKQ